MRLESAVNTNESIQTMQRIENLDSLLEVDEESKNYDTSEYESNVAPREYNFTKRKCRYSNKNTESQSRIRNTPYGRNQHNEAERQRNANMRTVSLKEGINIMKKKNRE